MPDETLTDLLYQIAHRKGREMGRDTTRLVHELPHVGVMTHHRSPYVHVALLYSNKLRPELAIMTEAHQLVAWVGVRVWQDQALITVRPPWSAVTTLCEVVHRQANRELVLLDGGTAAVDIKRR